MWEASVACDNAVRRDPGVLWEEDGGQPVPQTLSILYVLRRGPKQGVHSSCGSMR